jgi:hypothetical protein
MESPRETKTLFDPMVGDPRPGRSRCFLRVSRRVGELGPEALIRKPIDLDEQIRGLKLPAPPPRRVSP